MRIGRTLPPAAAPIGIIEIVSGVRGIFHGQKELERFRSELKEQFGVKHCFLVSSGKAAFALILQALKELFPARDDVIIPAFTCYTVPSSVIRAGLRLRLCDLHPDSLDFDFAKLSAMLSQAPIPANDAGGPVKKLLAVVPTHLFGFPSDVRKLRELIQDRGVTVVEDAAQAMGEIWDGRKLGTLGDISFFSLGRGKAFSAVEGGIILTDRDDIAEVLNRRVGSLSGYGFPQLISVVAKAAALMIFTHPLLFWIPRSVPFLRLGETLFDPHFEILKMSPFQAGLTANWMGRLQEMRDARKANGRRWLGIIGEIGGRGLCFQLSQLLSLLRFPIRIRDVEKRKTLLRESATEGAGIMPVYPESINRLSELRGDVPLEGFPVAERCARELVTLPTHGYVTQKDATVVRRLLSRAATSEGSRSA